MPLWMHSSSFWYNFWLIETHSQSIPYHLHFSFNELCGIMMTDEKLTWDQWFQHNYNTSFIRLSKSCRYQSASLIKEVKKSRPIITPTWEPSGRRENSSTWCTKTFSNEQQRYPSSEIWTYGIKSSVTFLHRHPLKVPRQHFKAGKCSSNG